jgi:hypothetical protein
MTGDSKAMTPVEENPTTQTSEIRSVTELFKRLRDETTTLFRQEVALVKAETSEKASRITRNVVFLAVGGAIAFAGFIFLLLGLDHLILVGLVGAGVSNRVAVWVAPLIVGVVIAAIGYGLLQKGVSTLRRERVAPHRTVQSLQENKEWLKHKIQ